MEKRNIMWKLSILAIVGVSIGCSAQVEGGGPVGVETQAEEIVRNLELAGYPDDEIDIDDEGVVIVGGDAVVDLQASHEIAGVDPANPEVEAAGFRQYRTHNQIGPSIDTICIDGSLFTGGKNLSSSLNSAIAKYNAENLRFQLVRTNGANAGCDAEITARTQPGLGGLAGFPSGGLPYHQFFVGTGIQLHGASVVTHVILHELGHCIGLRHSDYFDRAISCGSGGAEAAEPIGAVHIPGTPAGAVYNGSVMNSCYNFGVSGDFSTSDQAALDDLYGDPIECEDSCDADVEQCYAEFCGWNYDWAICEFGCDLDFDDCIDEC